MSRFRTVAAFVFAGMLISASLATGQASAPGAAQATPVPAAVWETAAPATVLHANANLVLVDVVVTDHGKAVHGLDRGRFHILETGYLLDSCSHYRLWSLFWRPESPIMSGRLRKW